MGLLGGLAIEHGAPRLATTLQLEANLLTPNNVALMPRTQKPFDNDDQVQEHVFRFAQSISPKPGKHSLTAVGDIYLPGN